MRERRLVSGDGIRHTLDDFAEDTGGRGHGELIWYKRERWK
jgi:hypothetical protein